MADRTVNRAPLSVNVPKDTTGFFVQTEFKGLCDDKNDVTIDPQSFADMENIYVDNNILMSRAPFKFYDGESYIIKQWQFGDYTLRYYRSVIDKKGEVVTDLRQLTNDELDSLRFLFSIKCVSHETMPTDEEEGIFSEKSYTMSIKYVGWNYLPRLFFVPIEDKIFGWFAGQDFICFNLVGKYLNGKVYPYFEDAAKYIYLPVHTQVINGIESEVEAKNFLTESYRKRYEYSAVSNTNFQKLEGKYVDVRMQGADTDNQSKFLYNMTVQKNQDKMLIYPYVTSGDDYEIDVVTNPRTNIILRYSKYYGTIEVSYDSRIFEALPKLDGIIGTPFLTKDGLYVIAFTTQSLMYCKLVDTTSEEVNAGFSEKLQWSARQYLELDVFSTSQQPIKIDGSFAPTAYFETIDNFSYFVKRVSDDSLYLYTEWLDSNNTRRACGTSNTISNFDSAKLAYKYLTSTASFVNLGPTVAVLLTSENESDKDKVYVNCYERNDANTLGTLHNNYRVDVTWHNVQIADQKGKFIWKMDKEGKFPVDGEIKSGDLVMLQSYPNNLPNEDNWVPTTEYQKGDWVRYQDGIYVATQNHTNQTPKTSGTDAYWKFVNNAYTNVNYRATNSQYYTGRANGMFACLRNTLFGRMRITKPDNSMIFTGDNVNFEPVQITLTYKPEELEAFLGPLEPAADDPTDSTWKKAFPNGLATGQTVTPVNDTATLIVNDAQESGRVSDVFYYDIHDRPFKYNNEFYILNGLVSNAVDTDIVLTSALVDSSTVVQSFIIGANASVGVPDNTEFVQRDTLFSVTFDRIKLDDDEYAPSIEGVVIDKTSEQFKLSTDGQQMLTNSYLYIDKNVINLPDNGILGPDIGRVITNRSSLKLIYDDTEDVTNICTLMADWIHLDNSRPVSHSRVTIGENTDAGYLMPTDITEVGTAGTTMAGYAHRYYLERLGISEGKWVVKEGMVEVGDYIRLRDFGLDSIDKAPVIPKDAPYNNTGKDISCVGLTYPLNPVIIENGELRAWKIGDDWPLAYADLDGTNNGLYPPIKPLLIENGIPRPWQKGDALPTGTVDIYAQIGATNRVVRPIIITETGVWYNVDGDIWTSRVDEKNRIQIDEFVNVTTDSNNDRTISLNNYVPDFASVLNETFFAYKMPESGDNLLEITEIRRDTDGTIDDRRSILLYMPKSNEQKTTNRITNLHPLSESSMGVFTGSEVFYVTPTELDDRVMYTALVKSKIPIGCRFGDDIITALNGQVIIFPTQRGLAAMAPQDFVATTERTLTYLSDPIQDKYGHFYNDIVMSSALNLQDDSIEGITPQIKTINYKYWILFYKYLDKEILAFDTRTNTWWRWTTPYPIRQLSVGSRLHAIMQMDYNPVSDYSIQIPPEKVSLMGVDFLYADKEVDLTYEINEFPELEYTPISNIGYYDDTVDGVLNGTSLLVPENKFVNDRRVLLYAEPMISWHITSQKIAFGQINNYKNIKAINISAKGTEPMIVRFFTKAFRNYYHPESSFTSEIKINDLRTFVQRMNLMHLVNFQYKIQNQFVENESSHQLKLNSLSIKYEVKEKVR